MPYIIEDWAGNVCFGGKTFDTFEDAWEHVRSETDEDAWDNYYVVDTEGGSDE